MRRYASAVALFLAFTGLAVGGCAKAAPDSRPAPAHTKARARHNGRQSEGTGGPAATAEPAATGKGAGASDGASSSARHGAAGKAVSRLAQSEAAARATRAVDAAVDQAARADGGHLSVAVDDLTTGVRASYDGGAGGYVTASIVKADILATLLYTGQREGKSLSEDDRELATEMIEESDNDAASDLWWQAGGAAGVNAANRVFGLRHTTAGPGPYWGLTTTTADDQVQLLRELLTTRSVLSSSARTYARGLMSSVDPGQRWGVPAAADPGSPVAVKNGWLPDPELWEINSIGEITRNVQLMLVAVLSEDNASEYGGISLVQRIAEKAVAAVAGA